MKISTGILLYRHSKKTIEYFLVHPGGPFWKNKDAGAWSIPKGELDENEDPLKAACREFKEETGFEVNGHFIALTAVKLKSGKLVRAWALEKNIDHTKIKSNTFLFEWPPRSAKKIEIPEVDKAGWFNLEDAEIKINPGQLPLLKELQQILGSNK